MSKTEAPPAYDDAMRGALTPSAPPSYEASMNEVTQGLTQITVTSPTDPLLAEAPPLPEKYELPGNSASTSSYPLPSSSSSSTLFPSHLSFLGLDDNSSAMKKTASESNLAREKS
ncbi:hypothetical protein WR25_05561 [Diploscapter pachys]|uniref:Uncharacterized protein n=1 Tax=Diploscapter pachys TaxID=2018661 RepID=A0A2A2M3N8_9BILA|nr:hypothetical protein WR25_05561 [Diploscapter pachys]